MHRTTCSPSCLFRRSSLTRPSASRLPTRAHVPPSAKKVYLFWPPLSPVPPLAFLPRLRVVKEKEIETAQPRSMNQHAHSHSFPPSPPSLHSHSPVPFFPSVLFLDRTNYLSVSCSGEESYVPARRPIRMWQLGQLVFAMTCFHIPYPCLRGFPLPAAEAATSSSVPAPLNQTALLKAAHSLLQPLMLRRIKQDVLTNVLPPKLEVTVRRRRTPAAPAHGVLGSEAKKTKRVIGIATPSRTFPLLYSVGARNDEKRNTNHQWCCHYQNAFAVALRSTARYRACSEPSTAACSSRIATSSSCIPQLRSHSLRLAVRRCLLHRLPPYRSLHRPFRRLLRRPPRRLLARLSTSTRPTTPRPTRARRRVLAARAMR